MCEYKQLLFLFPYSMVLKIYQVWWTITLMNYKRLQSPPVWVPEAIGSMIWCFNVLQWIQHIISLLRMKFLHSQNSFPIFLLPPPNFQTCQLSWNCFGWLHKDIFLMCPNSWKLKFYKCWETIDLVILWNFMLPRGLLASLKRRSILTSWCKCKNRGNERKLK